MSDIDIFTGPSSDFARVGDIISTNDPNYMEIRPFWRWLLRKPRRPLRFKVVAIPGDGSLTLEPQGGIELRLFRWYQRWRYTFVQWKYDVQDRFWN